jgi:anthranilate phosphoribosyltransferase
VPSYGGAQQHPNLMPLVALALARFGIPALVHGPLEGHGRVATAAVLRELGILPCASLREVQLRLGDPGVAYAPTALILPTLAQLLALRGRLGFENVAHQVARLVDPFGGEGLMLVPADDSTQLEPLRDAIAALGDHALLFEGAEGEAYADPQRRPAIEQLRAGERRVLFEAEPELAAAKAPRGASLPEAPDARSTARWIGMALDGKAALPAPIANLLACCLFAAGYTDDFNQSKAIVAVRAHKLVAA